jgi:hypothetical protein
MTQRRRDRLDRADAHDLRWHAAVGKADKARKWLEPMRLDRLVAGQDQAGGGLPF